MVKSCSCVLAFQSAENLKVHSFRSVSYTHLYAVYRILIQGGPVPEGSEFIKRLLVYVSDPWFHLWYLPMLIGLLILTPLLWEIVNSSRGKQWCEYMIVLFLAFQILTYTAGCFDLPWKQHIQNLINTVHPELITSYAGYYVLGHYQMCIRDRIVPCQGFYDYENKYKPGAVKENCPAPISSELTRRLQDYAVQGYRALGLESYARLDFIVTDDEKIYCLEANTLPGMTPTSLIPQEAAVLGMDYPTLCEELIRVSEKKYK